MELTALYMITLRNGTLEDADILAAIGGEIFRETYAGKMPEEDLIAYVVDAFNNSRIAAELGELTNQFILAFYNDALVGYAKISITTSFQIERMYVQQLYHGKKIGAALMRYCLEFAKKEGFVTVTLAVWEKNPVAIKFYLRWGFEVFDAQIFERGADRQTGLLMKKVL